MLYSSDEEDEDIVVPPSPPIPSQAGGFIYQSQDTREERVRQPPLPSLEEPDDIQIISPIGRGLLHALSGTRRSASEGAASAAQDEDSFVQVDDASRGSNSESGEVDVVEVGSSVSGRSSPDDVIEIDVESGSNNDDENDATRPVNPVPPPDIPQNLPPDGEESSSDSNLPQAAEDPASESSPQPSTIRAGESDTTLSVWTGGATAGPSNVSATPLAQHVQVLSSRDSPGDFRSPKRRRIMPAEPQTTAPCTTAADEDDDANCCPICFEDWTTSGSHRLCALRCGHLFGQSCIDKWLRGQGGKCPQCNAKAKRQDIRVLFAKSIKALDTTERDRALQDLQKEREKSRRLEMEAAQSRLQCQLVTEESNKLKTELEKLRQALRSSNAVPMSQSSVSTSQSTGRLEGQYILEKTVKIWEGGNCRVMANSTALGTLVVSQPSSSPLFPGFGIRKLNTLDFKTSQYLTIHSKAIRDLCFHPSVEDGVLLSASLDKTVKMTSVLSNTVIQSYDTCAPVWSCVWNADDRNYFYAGLMNGTVLEFDVRNTAEHTQELNKDGHKSPVTSIQYIPRDPQSLFRPGGIVVGQLAQVSFYEKKADNQYRLHMLPLDGNLSSLCFEHSTRNLLASFKPNTKYPTTRHLMCEMSSRTLNEDPTGTQSLCSCNVVQTFHGGRTHTMLSKSAMVPHPADSARLLVCAGEEASSSVHIWDCGTGHILQRLQAGGVVVDVCALQSNEQHFLAALTDKQLKIFRWR